MEVGTITFGSGEIGEEHAWVGALSSEEGGMDEGAVSGLAADSSNGRAMGSPYAEFDDGDELAKRVQAVLGDKQEKFKQMVLDGGPHLGEFGTFLPTQARAPPPQPSPPSASLMPAAIDHKSRTTASSTATAANNRHLHSAVEVLSVPKQLAASGEEDAEAPPIVQGKLPNPKRGREKTLDGKDGWKARAAGMAVGKNGVKVGAVDHMAVPRLRVKLPASGPQSNLLANGCPPKKIPGSTETPLAELQESSPSEGSLPEQSPSPRTILKTLAFHPLAIKQLLSPLHESLLTSLDSPPKASLSGSQDAAGGTEPPRARPATSNDGTPQRWPEPGKRAASAGAGAGWEWSHQSGAPPGKDSARAKEARKAAARALLPASRAGLGKGGEGDGAHKVGNDGPAAVAKGATRGEQPMLPSSKVAAGLSGGTEEKGKPSPFKAARPESGSKVGQPAALSDGRGEAGTDSHSAKHAVNKGAVPLAQGLTEGDRKASREGERPGKKKINQPLASSDQEAEAGAQGKAKRVKLDGGRAAAPAARSEDGGEPAEGKGRTGKAGVEKRSGALREGGDLKAKKKPRLAEGSLKHEELVDEIGTPVTPPAPKVGSSTPEETVGGKEARSRSERDAGGARAERPAQRELKEASGNNSEVAEQGQGGSEAQKNGWPKGSKGERARQAAAEKGAAGAKDTREHAGEVRADGKGSEKGSQQQKRQHAEGEGMRSSSAEKERSKNSWGEEHEGGKRDASPRRRDSLGGSGRRDKETSMGDPRPRLGKPGKGEGGKAAGWSKEDRAAKGGRRASMEGSSEAEDAGHERQQKGPSQEVLGLEGIPGMAHKAATKKLKEKHAGMTTALGGSSALGSKAGKGKGEKQGKDKREARRESLGEADRKRPVDEGRQGGKHGGASSKEKAEGGQWDGEPGNRPAEGTAAPAEPAVVAAPAVGKVEIISEEWVQCEKCNNWRLLPPSIQPDSLPERWFCTMNTWLPHLAKCKVAQDVTSEAVYRMLGLPWPPAPPPSTEAPAHPLPEVPPPDPSAPPEAAPPTKEKKRKLTKEGSRRMLPAGSQREPGSPAPKAAPRMGEGLKGKPGKERERPALGLKGPAGKRPLQPGPSSRPSPAPGKRLQSGDPTQKPAKRVRAEPASASEGSAREGSVKRVSEPAAGKEAAGGQEKRPRQAGSTSLGGPATVEAEPDAGPANKVAAGKKERATAQHSQQAHERSAEAAQQDGAPRAEEGRRQVGAPPAQAPSDATQLAPTPEAPARNGGQSEVEPACEAAAKLPATAMPAGRSQQKAVSGAFPGQAPLADAATDGETGHAGPRPQHSTARADPRRPPVARVADGSAPEARPSPQAHPVVRSLPFPKKVLLPPPSEALQVAEAEETSPRANPNPTEARQADRLEETPPESESVKAEKAGLKPVAGKGSVEGPVRVSPSGGSGAEEGALVSGPPMGPRDATPAGKGGEGRAANGGILEGDKEERVAEGRDDKQQALKKKHEEEIETKAAAEDVHQKRERRPADSSTTSSSSDSGSSPSESESSDKGSSKRGGTPAESKVATSPSRSAHGRRASQPKGSREGKTESAPRASHGGAEGAQRPVSPLGGQDRERERSGSLKRSQRPWDGGGRPESQRGRELPRSRSGGPDPGVRSREDRNERAGSRDGSQRRYDERSRSGREYGRYGPGGPAERDGRGGYFQDAKQYDREREARPRDRDRERDGRDGRYERNDSRGREDYYRERDRGERGSRRSGDRGREPHEERAAMGQEERARSVGAARDSRRAEGQQSAGRREEATPPKLAPAQPPGASIWSGPTLGEAEGLGEQLQLPPPPQGTPPAAAQRHTARPHPAPSSAAQQGEARGDAVPVVGHAGEGTAEGKGGGSAGAWGPPGSGNSAGPPPRAGLGPPPVQAPPAAAEAKGILGAAPASTPSARSPAEAQKARAQAIELKRLAEATGDRLKKTDIYMRSALKFMEWAPDVAKLFEHIAKEYELQKLHAGSAIAWKLAAVARTRSTLGTRHPRLERSCLQAILRDTPGGSPPGPGPAAGARSGGTPGGSPGEAAAAAGRGGSSALRAAAEAAAPPSALTGDSPSSSAASDVDNASNAQAAAAAADQAGGGGGAALALERAANGGRLEASLKPPAAAVAAGALGGAERPAGAGAGAGAGFQMGPLRPSLMRYVREASEMYSALDAWSKASQKSADAAREGCWPSDAIAALAAVGGNGGMDPLDTVLQHARIALRAFGRMEAAS